MTLGTQNMLRWGGEGRVTDGLKLGWNMEDVKSLNNLNKKKRKISQAFSVCFTIFFIVKF